MNKKIYAVCMLAMLLTAGCTQNKQETVPEDEDVVNLPEEEQQDEETGEEQKGYDVELSDKLSDFQFSINDTVYTLPAKLEEWKKAGWAYEKDDGKKALDPESFLEGETLDSESGALFVDVVNLDGEKKTAGRMLCRRRTAGEPGGGQPCLPASRRDQKWEPPHWTMSQRHMACPRTSMRKKIIYT
ncbi:MAG: hypothetical protein ACLRJA_15635 [Blautia producta]